MTITYLDEKQGLAGAATTVPALEGVAANAAASSNIPVFQNDSTVMIAKRGRPKGSRNKTTRATAGYRKGPGRPPKNKKRRSSKSKRGNRVRNITIRKIKPRKKKNMTTETSTTTTTINETRRGRKSEGKTCKLVCLITGSTRTAGSGYLSTKPSEFRSNYISRPALKLLRQGLTVQQVRQQLQQGINLNDISAEALQTAIQLNGKHKK